VYDYLKATEGTAFVNTDSNDLLQMQEARDLQKVLYYGTRSFLNTINGTLLQNTPYLALQWSVKEQEDALHQAASHLTGEYNLPNILAAICIGNHFKLSATQINAGIEGYQPQNNRSQIVKTAHNTLICDYYNANPSSMLVAIDNLGKMQASNKVMILGDMFEMGSEAAAEHKAVIEAALVVPANEHIFVGNDFFHQQADYRGTYYKTAEDAINAIKTKPITNTTVLIKGSRGMALERLVPLL